MSENLHERVTSYMLTRMAEAERLTGVLAERIREVLQEDEFEVEVKGRIISITGVGARGGNTFGLMPALIWQLPLSATRRLRMIFEGVARNLQHFLTCAYNRPWPAVTAEPHVSVGDDAILVWWGGASETDAVARLRPIPRVEIGV